MITFISKRYPHVEELVAKQNKSDEDRRQLSEYGTKGNMSPKRRKALPDRSCPLFPINLDPNGEFPHHHVLYRGPRFCLIAPKRTRKKNAPHTASQSEEGDQYFEELCRAIHADDLRRDAQAHHMKNLAGVRKD